MCKCVCVCLHVKAKSQYWVSFLITLLFWERVSRLTQRLAVWQDLLASNSQRFTCLNLPSIKVAEEHRHAQPLYLSSGVQTQVLKSAWQYLPTWTISWDDTTHFKQPKQRYKNWCPNSMSRHTHVGFYLYLQRHTNCQKDIHQFDRGHLRAKTTDNAFLCTFSCTFKVFYKSFT